jgi:hypothetical protein|tara:strand:+ start:511 stop:777 length:267 start_codon:yes stop_codon:yes gene_type:complete
MANNNTTIAPEGAVRTETSQVSTIVIKLMSGNGIFEPTETQAGTVGELRVEKELTGTVVVNDVIATDSTPLDADDRISHVAGGKRGGK